MLYIHLEIQFTVDTFVGTMYCGYNFNSPASSRSPFSDEFQKGQARVCQLSNGREKINQKF